MTEQATNRLAPTIPVQLTDQVVRYVAPNGGFMTGPGTNCYWIGSQSLILIDPGPATPAHIDALVDYSGGKLTAILVTHTHRDHSPAAMEVAKRTGATIYGMNPPATPENDQHFSPDFVVQHDQLIKIDDHRLRVIHTPGHASNHVCFLYENEQLLFTGDHIMNGSTVVIAAPDGNMNAYLRSLALLKDYPIDRIAPGHGALLDNPSAVVDWIIDHRLQREAKVVQKLEGLAPCDIDVLLPAVYDEVDARLLPIARYSLEAHLQKLLEDGRAQLSDDGWQMID